MKSAFKSSGRFSPAELKCVAIKTSSGTFCSDEVDRSILESLSLEVHTEELVIVIGDAMLKVLVGYDTIDDLQIVNSNTLFMQILKQPVFETIIDSDQNLHPYGNTHIIESITPSRVNTQRKLLSLLTSSPWPGTLEFGVKVKKLKAFQRVIRSVPELAYKGLPRVVFQSNGGTPDSTNSMSDETSLASESPPVAMVTETVDDWLSTLISPDLNGRIPQSVAKTILKPIPRILSPPRSVEIAEVLSGNSTYETGVVSSSPMRPSRLEFVSEGMLSSTVSVNAGSEVTPVLLFDYCLGLLKEGACEAALECAVAHPEIALQADDNGEYLLHHAAVSPGSSLELVAAIYNINPDAIAKRSSTYRFPLHCAAANSASSSESIFMLYKMYPHAAAARTKSGKTPLHTAAAFSGSLDVLKALCILHPQAAKVKDKNGSYPLHLAAGHTGITRSLLEIIVDLFPAAASERNDDGNLPFHIAAGNLLSIDLITVILEANPGALWEYGAHGRLGIHFATANPRASFEVVKTLGDKWPGSIKMEDKDGFTPMQLVLDGCCAYDFVDYLLSMDFPISEDGVRDPSSSDSWAVLMNPTSEDGILISKSIVELYLRKYKAYGRSLVYLPDRYGRACYNIAHKEIRQIMSSYILFLGNFQ